jgi:hypothetical protein
MKEHEQRAFRCEPCRQTLMFFEVLKALPEAAWSGGIPIERETPA